MTNFTGSVSDSAEETVEIILKPRNTNSTAESRYLKTTINASIHHIKFVPLIFHDYGLILVQTLTLPEFVLKLIANCYS